MTSAVGEPRPRSVNGVDTIRLVAALWVAFGHGARFPVQDLVGQHASVAAQIAVIVSNSMFNGVDAVVVFFLISGLCIHYPNVELRTVNPIKFIARRFIRVGIPLIVILALVNYFGERYLVSLKEILWTVYCELAFYFIYPFLLYVSRRTSWMTIFVVSLLNSVAIISVKHDVRYLWEFGPLAWLFCLPFWLLGVMMADRFTLVSISMQRLWLWRAGALLHGMLANELLYYSPLRIGLVWTIPPFAVFCYFWLSRELAHWRRGAPFGLEALGAASYSIYLTHKLPLTFLEMHARALGPISRWGLGLGLIMLCTGLFYFLVERPSHALARRLGTRRQLLPPREAPAPTVAPVANSSLHIPSGGIG